MKKRLIAFLLALTLLYSTLPIVHATESGEEADHIKWVDFDVSYSALIATLDYDIKTYDTDIHLNWIELLAVLGARYGGSFSKYKRSHLDDLAKRLLAGESLEDITQDMNYYDYYLEAYSAILGEFVGQHRAEVPDPENPEQRIWEDRYGLKVYSPIAEGFSYGHFDDFGAGRNYGYRRRHLGHDLFGSVGTPIVAIESGTVQVVGWNQYGGWRIGIRSFDGLRYYYYAHLRQNRPYHPDIVEGQVVKAGDVIGYMGRTGYSRKENVNGIRETHLHWGLQLIFHPEQEEGPKEIWVDVYAITRLLARNQSETYRVAETKEFYRTYDFDEPNLFGRVDQ
ncbi:MAG: M23 family metallopeptidase [Oscillospiraceae bacterium]|nr:M23 family metallopeptidase [Oscillospiraceae bacterium]